MMVRFRCASLTISIAVGMAGVAFGMPTDRYWVGGDAGLWRDPANWSPVQDGLPSGGVPQTGDRVLFTTRTECAFDGSTLLEPRFAELSVSGSGLLPNGTQGATLFYFNGGTMLLDRLLVGDGSIENYLFQTGGVLHSQTMLIGAGLDDWNMVSFGGDSLVTAAEVSLAVGLGGAGFEVTGDADVEVERVRVGVNGGEGQLGVYGGRFSFDTIETSVVDGAATGGGQSGVSFGGGIVRGGEIVLGATADDRFTVSGGDVEIERLVVSAGPFLTNRVWCRGGSFRVNEEIVLGADDHADSDLDVFGGYVSTPLIRMRESEHATARIEVGSGHLAAGEIRVYSDRRRALRIRGGLVETDVLTLTGPDRESPTVEMDGGALDVGVFTLGSGSGEYPGLDIEDATLRAGVLRPGPGNWCPITVSGDALIEVDHLFSAGPDGGQLVFDIDSGRFVIGTLETGLIGEDGSGMGAHGGDFTITKLLTRPGSGLGLGGDASVQIQAGMNTGAVGVRDTSELRGLAMVGDQALLTNTGILRAHDNATVAINIDNSGTIEFDDNATYVGHITGPGMVELEGGTIVPPSGVFVNTGTIGGEGLIEGGFHNDGVLRGTSFEGALRVASSAVMSESSTVLLDFTRARPEPVLAVEDDVTLRGNLRVVLNSDRRFRTIGEEFTVVESASGSVTGTFSDFEIIGPGAELVYEPNRAVLRVIACSSSDIAVPYGTLDVDDVLAFVRAFAAGDMLADFGVPFGVLDTLDVVLFLGRFRDGCE